jgi:peptidyl-prolyl cis-trans isomerase SurA
MKKISLTLLLCIVGSSSVLAQNSKILDRIVAQVNDHVILKSDIDSLVKDIMLREPGIVYEDMIWYEILETQIDKYVLIEQAAIDSITVGEDQIERRLDDYIRQLTANFGSERALEDALGKSIFDYKNEWRPRVRENELANKVREAYRSKITITRREVEAFFKSIPPDSLPIIPEQVQMAHIVAIPPLSGDAKERAFKFASAIRDSILNHGVTIEEMARRHSADPSARQTGGLIPLMSMSDLVPEYSAASAALEPGQISEVVETVFGYHVIRLNRRVADQIETHHVLIQISSSESEDEVAIRKLEAIRDSLINHGKSFTEMARRHSDDKATAPFGGRLMDPMTGDTMLDVDRIDPALYSMVILLDNIGDISDPRPYNVPPSSAQRELRKAYRLVQLQKKNPEHRANLTDDYELIANFALQRKQLESLSKYLDELRKTIYVEYKITVPNRI